jgi:hypothetical protein
VTPTGRPLIGKSDRLAACPDVPSRDTEAVEPIADPWSFEDRAAAFGAAAERIVPNRRRMSIEDAEDILRSEFSSRGLRIGAEELAHYARSFHRGFWWAVLHPVQAHREGVRWSWRGKRD